MQLDIIAKHIILLGIILIAVGFLLLLSRYVPGMGHLPGDIHIKHGNNEFYFPLTSCIILSIIISLILYFFKKQ